MPNVICTQYTHRQYTEEVVKPNFTAGDDNDMRLRRGIYASRSKVCRSVAVIRTSIAIVSSDSRPGKPRPNATAHRLLSVSGKCVHRENRFSVFFALSDIVDRVIDIAAAGACWLPTIVTTTRRTSYI